MFSLVPICSLWGWLCSQDLSGEGSYELCDDGGESEICRSDCTLSSWRWFYNLTAGEECDDGNRTTEACPDDEPCVVCGELCLNVPGARCGDGVLDAQFGEECDDGNRLDDLNGCSTNCRQNNVCGDGIVSPFSRCAMTDLRMPAVIVMLIVVQRELVILRAD